MCVGCGGKKSSNDEMLAQICSNTYNEGYNKGYHHGTEDGSSGNSYGESYNDVCYYAEEPTKSYKEGYKKGYDEGYNAEKSEYDAELAKRVEIARQLLEDYENSEVTTSVSTTPNTYPSPSISSSTLQSNERVNGNYSNYKETSDCVEGVVVYEGTGDYYIVETRMGYTVLEVYSGILYEGDKVRGELNKYNFRYIINRNRNSEVRVYIEDYMLSDSRALEWLGEHDHLKYDDQSAYNNSKE